MPRRTTRGSACQNQPCLLSATWNQIGCDMPSRMRGGDIGPGWLHQGPAKSLAYADETVIARDMRRILNPPLQGAGPVSACRTRDD